MIKRAILTAAFAVAIAAGPASASHLVRGSSTITCKGAVTWNRAASLEGTVATLTGRVASTKFAVSSNDSPTFLDLGNAYPSTNRLSLVIWIENRSAFGRPESKYLGRTVCVRGLVSDYHGSPEIILRSPSQITIRH